MIESTPQETSNGVYEPSNPITNSNNNNNNNNKNNSTNDNNNNNPLEDNNKDNTPQEIEDEEGYTFVTTTQQLASAPARRIRLPIKARDITLFLVKNKVYAIDSVCYRKYTELTARGKWWNCPQKLLFGSISVAFIVFANILSFVLN